MTITVCIVYFLDLQVSINFFSKYLSAYYLLIIFAVWNLMRIGLAKSV